VRYKLRSSKSRYSQLGSTIELPDRSRVFPRFSILQLLRTRRSNRSAASPMTSKIRIIRIKFRTIRLLSEKYSFSVLDLKSRDSCVLFISEVDVFAATWNPSTGRETMKRAEGCLHIAVRISFSLDGSEMWKRLRKANRYSRAERTGYQNACTKTPAFLIRSRSFVDPRSPPRLHFSPCGVVQPLRAHSRLSRERVPSAVP